MKKFSLSLGASAFLIAVCINLVLQLVFSAILALGVNADVTNYAFMATVQVCNFLVVFFLVKKTGAKPDFNLLKPRLANTLTSVLLVLITFVGGFIATIWVSKGLASLGVTATAINLDGINLVFALVCTCVLAPIGEEAVYRYALLGGLKEKFSAPVAVVLSALAFAFMHMGPHQTFYPFLLGLALGTVAIKTGNTFYCFIMHSLSNLVAVCLSFFPQIEAFFLSNAWFIFAAFVVLALGAIAFGFVAKLLKTEHTFASKRDKNEENNSGLWVYLFAIAICLLIWIMMFFA